MNGLNEIFPPIKFIKVLNFTDKTWLLRYLGEVSVKIWISGEGNGSPLQYSCLGNPLDRGAWWSTVHGIAVRYHWATDTHTKLRRYLMVQYTLSPLLSPAGSSTWEAGWLPPTPLNPCCKSWGLSACNSWPWANKRLKLFTGKKKKIGIRTKWACGEWREGWNSNDLMMPGSWD